MHCSALLLSALAATSALASHHEARTIGNSIHVTLEDLLNSLGSGTDFEEDQLAQTKMPVGSSGPVTTFALKLGPDVKDKKLRCQIVDKEGTPIVGVRGNNTDITFSDGGT